MYKSKRIVVDIKLKFSQHHSFALSPSLSRKRPSHKIYKITFLNIIINYYDHKFMSCVVAYCCTLFDNWIAIYSFCWFD